MARFFGIDDADLTTGSEVGAGTGFEVPEPEVPGTQIPPDIDSGGMDIVPEPPSVGGGGGGGGDVSVPQPPGEPPSINPTPPPEVIPTNPVPPPAGGVSTPQPTYPEPPETPTPTPPAPPASPPLPEVPNAPIPLPPTLPSPANLPGLTGSFKTPGTLSPGSQALQRILAQRPKGRGPTPLRRGAGVAITGSPFAGGYGPLLSSAQAAGLSQDELIDQILSGLR